MTNEERNQKIEYLLKRMSDRFTRKDLESRSDRFIRNLYLVEQHQEDCELLEAINSI